MRVVARAGRFGAAALSCIAVCCLAATVIGSAKSPRADPLKPNDPASRAPSGTGQPSAVAAGPPTVASLGDDQLKLRGLQDSIDLSEGRRKALSVDIEGFRADRAKAQSALIELTRKVGDAETAVADAEGRLDALSGKEAATRRSLDSRRATVAEVLAALQRMGRKPPPALLADPEDVLKAIRTSMLLGSVLPGMRAETDALVADLAELTRTRRAIAAERDTLEKNRAALVAERDRLGGLIEARQEALGKAESEMAAERDKAKQLASEATSLKDLIGRSERDSAAAGQAAEEARRSDEKLAGLMPNGAPPAGSGDPARLAPAVSFASTKGTLSLPASGSVLRRFGEDDGLGSAEKGLVLETRPSAVVTAPVDAWVAYAGPYRSFGQVLILNAGGGYYIVLAGTDRTNVSLGQFVLAGEPVAMMGDGTTKTAAAMALGAVKPVLYVEFRKDGSAIDPGPWWAKPGVTKVRG